MGNDSKGNVLVGSKSDLKNTIRRGAEIKMFRGEYVDSADSTLIVGDEVCAQSIHHVSKASWATFQGNAYWWFTVAYTTGDFSMSRRYVRDRIKSADSQTGYGFKWFARKVEDKYMTVFQVTGYDISAVNAYIQAVKQRGNGVTVKIESISLNKEEYYRADNLEKSSIETLEDPTGAKGKWDWMLVNTNGKVKTANYLVGEGQGSVSSSAADMKWFIDRREWNIVLDVGPTSVNSGSKEHLANEIKDGADVRYSWIGSTEEYTFMEADNIGFDGSKPDFGAQHIRSVLLKPNGNEYKFDVTSNKLTWLFSITTNSGVERSSKWIVGEHASRGEKPQLTKG